MELDGYNASVLGMRDGHKIKCYELRISFLVMYEMIVFIWKFMDGGKAKDNLHEVTIGIIASYIYSLIIVKNVAWRFSPMENYPFLLSKVAKVESSIFALFGEQGKHFPLLVPFFPSYFIF